MRAACSESASGRPLDTRVAGTVEPGRVLALVDARQPSRGRRLGTGLRAGSTSLSPRTPAPFKADQFPSCEIEDASPAPPPGVVHKRRPAQWPFSAGPNWQ